MVYIVGFFGFFGLSEETYKETSRNSHDELLRLLRLVLLRLLLRRLLRLWLLPLHIEEKRRPVVDVVMLERHAVLELLTLVGQALQRGRDAERRLNLGLDDADGVACWHVQRDGRPATLLHEDLHARRRRARRWDTTTARCRRPLARLRRLARRCRSCAEEVAHQAVHQRGLVLGVLPAEPKVVAEEFQGILKENTT